MPLDCTYRAAFGHCEAELLARDEATRLRDALYDTNVNRMCSVPEWSDRTCNELAVGVLKLDEVGWVPACEKHMVDDDEDGCIRLRAKAEAGS
jgi:hypothetical protein